MTGIIVLAAFAAFGLLIAGIEYFSRRAARDKRRAGGTAAAVRPVRPVSPVAHANAMHAISARYLPAPKHAATEPRRDKQPWETDHLPVMRPEPYEPLPTMAELRAQYFQWKHPVGVEPAFGVDRCEADVLEAEQAARYVA